ncbi:DUF3291 domain-containing protein [Salibacter sp.]|uniref:DUF3291 domain-containing protein n=1 Tax=Salibacter sp. TaxID=2010995 RepID=UPI00287035BA|nr:DUF3291 domain-containing protein [Salibacter sp.]MDR9398700.1 DUF3291 domain-containing protein [Salibacter sp.]MDR9488351.1 DUF3291 domain-containing protein [Salibacter sp.]
MNNKKNSQPFTAITFFNLNSRNKMWALAKMRNGGNQLNEQKGNLFSKLMGSGRGAGFSIIPNFNVYSMLTVFKSEQHFIDFTNSEFWQNYNSRSHESFTVILSPIEVKGTWNNLQPFGTKNDPVNELRAVITRASIKKSKLVQFWKQVPATSKAIEKAKGKLFSIGIGELPLIEQATFSMWENSKAIRDYAYRNKAHKKAVTDTHKIQWYSEEMFARFNPIATIGTFNGKKPLEDYGIISFEDVPSQAELLSLTRV